jgi:photosystem II stability/assembly factor-like uncharacterized protein
MTKLRVIIIMRTDRLRSLFFGALCRVALLLCISNPVRGQWQIVAPNLIGRLDSTRGCLTYKDGVLWAGHLDTLWKSIDTGVTWRKVPLPLIDTDIWICEVWFSDSLNGLVGTYGSGVFLTSDGGKSWSLISLLKDIASVLFDASAQQIWAVRHDMPETFLSSDGGANWTNTDYYPHAAGIGQVTEAHDGSLFGLFWDDGIAQKASLFTHGKGSAFVQVSNQTFAGDSWSLAVDSCDSRRVYIVNEEYYSYAAGPLSRFFLTADGGLTWDATIAAPSPFFNGSIALGPKAIYCQTVENGVMRSSDLGETWEEIGGPSSGRGGVDMRMISALDDNTVVAVDSEGSIWRTFNSGDNPLPHTSRAGTLSAQSLEFTSGLCDTTMTQSVVLHSCYCDSAHVTNQWFSGKDSAYFSLINKAPMNPDCDDTVVIGFYSDSNRNYNAQLEIAQGNGDVLNVSLSASPMQADFVAQVQSFEDDTIGGSFWVLFGLTASKPVTSIDMMLHYDTSWLAYQGSVLPSGLSIDVGGGTEYPGHSELRITGSEVQTLPEIIFYARFAVYPSSSQHPQSWIDSIHYEIESGICDYFWNDTVPITIIAPQNCATNILSEFLRTGMIIFQIAPNPAGNEVQLLSSVDAGDVTAILSDEYGRVVSRQQLHPIPGEPAALNVAQLPPAVYFIQIEFAGGLRTLRFVKID